MELYEVYTAVASITMIPFELFIFSMGVLLGSGEHTHKSSHSKAQISVAMTIGDIYVQLRAFAFEELWNLLSEIKGNFIHTLLALSLIICEVDKRNCIEIDFASKSRVFNIDMAFEYIRQM